MACDRNTSELEDISNCHSSDSKYKQKVTSFTKKRKREEDTIDEVEQKTRVGKTNSVLPKLESPTTPDPFTIERTKSFSVS
mmetsp:Transcript_1121/g.1483  ORF Transcript_1121/g.1483 Transcript_1121/m.1483 type:complete len:81 (-) Transcript_1121:223-465(-)